MVRVILFLRVQLINGSVFAGFVNRHCEYEKRVRQVPHNFKVRIILP